MGDSDVNRRRAKEWIGRRLSSVFHPTWPKGIAYVIILLAGIWLFLIWTNKVPLFIYCGIGADSASLGNIYSTLIMVLATVSALTLSLVFIGVQISLANFYSPRVVKVHFGSLHFIGIGLVFLFTIVYLSSLLYQAQNWNLEVNLFAETGFILYLTCLFLLIPYLWITIRLLQPRNLLQALLGSITTNDFYLVTRGNPRKINAKIQPIVDIIVRSAKENMLRTVEEAFEAIMSLVVSLEHNSPQAELSRAIGIVLSRKMGQIGLYANSLRQLEVSLQLLTFIQRLTDFYSSHPIRTGLLAFQETLRDLSYDWSLRYSPAEYPLQYAKGLRALADVYLQFSGFVPPKERKRYILQAEIFYRSTLNIFTEELFPVQYATIRSNLGEVYNALSGVTGP